MNALQFQKKLLSMQENMMNFALMLTANRDDAQDLMQDTYQIQEITKAINGLNDELKVPFSMFLSGYKYNEIADKLNVPLGTVKSRIFFARQELQKVLKDFRLG